MSLTISGLTQTVVGDLAYVSGSLAYDSSYPTGGESFAPTDVGLSSFDLVLCSPTKGVIFEYDYANSKLKAVFPTGGGGTPASALAVPKVSSGSSSASAVDATTPTITPGVGKEVASTQNLSTLTGVKFVAFGRR
jgi:hypothetical protein